jgi:DNA-directed RNA polymerase subunit RPC12/RpoP
MEATKTSGSELECPQCGAPVAMPDYAEGAVCAFCGALLTRGVVAPAAAPGIQKQTLRSVQCSQCAGPLDAWEGKRILVCAHCGVRVAVLEHDGFSRWYFPSKVTRTEAAIAGTRWLAEYPGIAKEARAAHLVEAQLVYAPIWEHKALVAGWEFGYKIRTTTQLVTTRRQDMFGDEEAHLELGAVKEDVQEPRLQERRFFQPAADFGALGAVRPRITGRELMVPALAGELEPTAIVLGVEGTGAEVVAAGRRAAIQPLSGAVNPDSHLFVFRESTTIIYYPLWILRYEKGADLCRVVVNGRNGSVNSGVAPASNTTRIALLVAQVAAVAVAVAVLIWLASRVTGHSRVSLVAAAVIVSLLAVLMIWRFRTVGEVEFHEPFAS